jgi:hypothetical protein
MGVDRTDYIVYGWKLPYKLKTSIGDNIDLWSDKFRPMIEGKPGEKFSIISDGMCGDYNVFGIILERGGDKWEGWDFVELNIHNFNVDDLKSKYVELFESEPDTNPTLFIFSHFS